MVKSWWNVILMMACFYPGILMAQEESELNAFGYPDKEFVTVIEAQENTKENPINLSMPDCNDPDLIKNIKEALLPYIQNKDTTIKNRRRTELLLKNLKNFSWLKSENIDPQVDVAAADRLIELKINQHKRNGDIKICKNTNVTAKADIYAFMYYTDDGLTVEIVNFGTEHPVFILTSENSKNLDIAKE